ncbi:hypothetical protein Tco_0936684 [Tanacetum coccineum]|uniref:Uncharacterized protein n=1 Tax=Tanacetum coccineum TaxID=301880 RepID=A0ABQ5DJ25_9ASTR
MGKHRVGGCEGGRRVIVGGSKVRKADEGKLESVVANEWGSGRRTADGGEREHVRRRDFAMAVANVGRDHGTLRFESMPERCVCGTERRVPDICPYRA